MLVRGNLSYEYAAAYAKYILSAISCVCVLVYEREREGDLAYGGRYCVCV